MNIPGVLSWGSETRAAGCGPLMIPFVVAFSMGKASIAPRPLGSPYPAYSWGAAAIAGGAIGRQTVTSRRRGHYSSSGSRSHWHGFFLPAAICQIRIVSFRMYFRHNPLLRGDGHPMTRRVEPLPVAYGSSGLTWFGRPGYVVNNKTVKHPSLGSVFVFSGRLELGLTDLASVKGPGRGCCTVVVLAWHK